MRLFVAVDVPEHLKEAIEERVVRPLGDLAGARWTRPEGRHLTLKFLGNVDDEREPSITEVVREVASRHDAFETSFSEVGGFPNLRRPRVLWIGLQTGGGPLASIAADLETSFERLGFAKETRPFRGHLTLARFPRPAAIEVPPVEVPGESFTARELVLFESRGGRYTARGHFPL